LFVPPFADVTVTVLFFAPEEVLVTFTVTTHGVPATTVPPENVTLPAPAAGLNVAPPQFVTVAPAGFATTSPAGNVSVNPTPVWLPGFPAGFVIVNVSVDVPPIAIVVGLNDFVIVGGPNTLSVAVLLA